MSEMTLESFISHLPKNHRAKMELTCLKAERDKAFAKIRGLRGVLDRLYRLDDITDTSILPQIEKLETELAAAKMEIECEERRFNALTELLHEVSTRADKAEAERDDALARVEELTETLRWIGDSGINGKHYQSHSSLTVLARRAVESTTGAAARIMAKENASINNAIDKLQKLTFDKGTKVIAISDSVGKCRIGKGYKKGDIFTVATICDGENSDHFIPVEAKGVAFWCRHFVSLITH
jgi:chromosome segregation ATPase